MDGNKKRKREVDNPRITYHALTRTFDRLFKEASLAEMKDVARRKLKLSSTVSVSLAQIRDGKTIDLDDDDDFDAFYAVAHSTSLVNVQVIVGPETTVPEPDNPARKKKRKKPNSSNMLSDNVRELEATGQSIRTAEVSPTHQHVPFSGSGTGDVEASESISVPPKKKRKRKASTVIDSIEAHSQETTGVPPAETSVPGIFPSPTEGHEKNLAVVVQERGAGESKNARRRKQKLPQQQLPLAREDNMDPGAQEITTINESPKEYPTWEPSKTKKLLFPEELASAISKTIEMNQRHSGASSNTDTTRTSTRAKIKMDPRAVVSPNTVGKGKRHYKNRLISDADESEQRETRITTGKTRIPTDNNDSNGATRRLRARTRLSKADELEAANADVKATALRILAAKRASLVQETGQNVQSLGTRQSPPASNGPETDGIRRGHPPASLSEGIAPEGSSPHVAAPANLITINATPIPRSLVPPSHMELTSASLGSSPPTLSSAVTQHLASDLDSSSDDVSSTSMHDDTSGTCRSTLTPLVLGNTYANIDLEALIRGPKIPFMIADITSPDSSDEEGEEEQLELEEDTQEEQSSRRTTQQHGHSSEEDTDVEIDDGDPSVGVIVKDSRLPSTVEGPSTSPQGNSASDTPFRAVDSIGFSQVVDDFSITPFKGAREENDTLLEMAKEEATRSLDVVQQAGAKHSIGNFTNTTSITPLLAHEPLPTHSTTTDFGLTPNTKVLEKLSDVLSACDVKAPETPRRNGIIQRMRGRDGKVGQGKIDFATPSKFGQLGDNEEPGIQRNIAERSGVTSRMILPLQTLGGDGHNSHFSASVPLAKGKVQQAAIADAPTLAPTSSEKASAKVLPEIQSSTLKSMPLDTWVTLKPSSPVLDADSTTMIDELVSSSPDRGSPVFNRHSPRKEPLFILTESQAPFPYSQWTGMAPEEDQQADSNDSDDEEMMDTSIRSRLRIKNTSKYNTYRTLTDITSQQSLFATPPTLQSAQPRATKYELADMYGPRSQVEKNESESESGSGSESESDVKSPQEKSHIPKGRRAGVIQKRKK